MGVVCMGCLVLLAAWARALWIAGSAGCFTTPHFPLAQGVFDLQNVTIVLAIAAGGTSAPATGCGISGVEGLSEPAVLFVTGAGCTMETKAAHAKAAIHSI